VTAPISEDLRERIVEARRQDRPYVREDRFLASCGEGDSESSASAPPRDRRDQGEETGWKRTNLPGEQRRYWHAALAFRGGAGPLCLPQETWTTFAPGTVRLAGTVSALERLVGDGGGETSDAVEGGRQLGLGHDGPFHQRAVVVTPVSSSRGDRGGHGGRQPSFSKKLGAGVSGIKV
jgi:hypothetical protein